MGRREPCQLAVHLDSIEQLANSSAFDPSARWIFEDPAVDYMADELRAGGSRRDLHVCVVLPPEIATQPHTLAKVRHTIALYCKATLRHLDNEIGGLKRQAIGTFWFGFAVLAVVLTLEILVEHVALLSGAPSTYITEGLLIIGWVAAWFPVDMALYSRWPLNRDKKIYRALMEARVEVRAEECGPGSDGGRNDGDWRESCFAQLDAADAGQGAAASATLGGMRETIHRPS
jgi:hypothetical protein